MRVSHLIDDDEALIATLEKYEAALEESESGVELQGKTLEDANREQGVLMHKYSRLFAEARAIAKLLELRSHRTRADLTKKIKKGSDLALGDRVIDKYVDGEQSMIDDLALVLEFKLLEEKLGAVVEAIKIRGFALNNITRSRIENVHMAVL